MVLSERHVQAIWFDPALRPTDLCTRTGLAVRVVHPGDWNVGPGPDFIGAVLEIGPEHRRVVGDVEVHLSPHDWETHGHGQDPAYRHVIAHVTWRSGVDPVTLPCGAVTIWIGRFLASETSFSPECIDLDAYPRRRPNTDLKPCLEKLKGKPSRVSELLAQAGSRRLHLKAGAIALRIRRENHRQTFYAETMRALGYAHNADGFRRMAELVPYACAASEPENLESAYRVASTFVAWHRGGVRPHNAPEKRLSTAARLFTASAAMDLAEARDVTPSSCRRMVGVLTANGLVGRGRAGAILANVVIPFALACGHISSVPEWLPPEDISEKVRRIACRMLGCDHNPPAWYARNGLMIQGLLHIGCEACAQYYPQCDGCPVTTDREPHTT